MNIKTCEFCGEDIHEADGVWVDRTDGDGCLQEKEDGSDQVHRPAPDEMACEGCGNDMAWDYSEKFCDSCVAEEEEERRYATWVYWHA